MKYYVLPFIQINKLPNNKFLINNNLNGRSIETGELVYAILNFIGTINGKTFKQISEKFNKIEHDKLDNVINILIKNKAITSDCNYENSLMCIKECKETLLGFKNYNKEESEKICVIGVPFSKGNPVSLGQMKFPDELRRYTTENRISINDNNYKTINFRVLDNFNYDQFIINYKNNLLRDYGNIFIDNSERIDFIYNKIEIITKDVIKSNNIPIFIGGDHSITYPIIKSILKKYKKINIVHFDAHTDTYVSPYDYVKHDKTVHTHGNFMKYCLELKGVNKVYQYGIRGFENLFCNESHKQKIYYSDLIKSNIKHSNLYNLSDNIPCYITFDLDCLNTCSYKGTATPIFKGLDIEDVVFIIRNLLINKKIIGVDIVEGNTDYDNTNISKQIALYILINFLNQINLKNNLKF